MREIMGYYCWFKQVNLADAAREQFDLRPVGLIVAGGRPPTRFLGTLAFSSGEAGQQNAGDGLAPIENTNFLYSGLGFACAADVVFPGDASKGLISYHAIPGDRASALRWITQPEGRQWIRNAQHYFLFQFGVQGPECIASHAALPRAWRPVPYGYREFDDALWDNDFKREAYRASYFAARRWATASTMSALDRALAPRSAEAELNDVRTEAGHYAIDRTQAETENLSAWHAVTAVLEAANLGNLYSSTKYRTIELIGRLLDETIAPLAHYKLHYNIGRPTALDATIPTPLGVPGHPSYPSGHATQAHLVALVLGKVKVLGAYRTHMENAARAVALRRVRAGMHFPMDASGGEVLANELWQALLVDEPSDPRRGKFLELLVDAAYELAGGVGGPAARAGAVLDLG